MSEKDLDYFFTNELDFPSFPKYVGVFCDSVEDGSTIPRVAWRSALAGTRFRRDAELTLVPMETGLNYEVLSALNQSHEEDSSNGRRASSSCGISGLTLREWTNGFEALGSCRHLRALALLGGEMDDSGALALGNALRSTGTLTKFSASNIKVPSLHFFRDLMRNGLALNTTLIELGLHNLFVEDRDAIRELGRAVGAISTLRALAVDQRDWREGEWRVFLTITSSSKSLKKLQIACSTINDVDRTLALFATVERFKLWFDFGEPEDPTRSSEFYSWLKNLKELEFALSQAMHNVAYFNARRETVDSILCKLENSSSPHVKLKAELFASASVWSKLSNLVDLEVDLWFPNQIDDLARYASVHLERLDVTMHETNADWAPVFVSVGVKRRWRRLKALNVEDRGNWVHPQEISRLEPLSECLGRIKHLGLIGWSVTTKESSDFFAALGDNRSLTRLRVGKVDRVALDVLCDVLPFTRLERLTLEKSCDWSRFSKVCASSRTVKRACFFTPEHFDHPDEARNVRRHLESASWPPALDSDDDVFGFASMARDLEAVEFGSPSRQEFEERFEMLRRTAPGNAVRFSKLSFFGFLWACFADPLGDFGALGDGAGRDGNEQLKRLVWECLRELDEVTSYLYL